jgi:hypothetical protein
MRKTKRRIIGMAGGTLWMIAVSTGFATLSLMWIDTPTARAVLAGAVGLAVLLLGISIGAMRAARGIPGEVPPRTSEDQVMMRNFWRVVAAEIVGLAVVNSLCKFYGQDGLMAPLDLIIVGLHFVALARVFRTPRYSAMGWLFCVVPIATMLSVPERTQVGHAPAWFVIPSLLCALVVWLTAVANVRDVFHLVRDTSMVTPSV